MNFTVKVTDSGGNFATQAYSLVINPPLTVTTTNANLPVGVVNTTYQNTSLNASGGLGGYTWSIIAGTLANTGLALNSGVISGTPTTAGTINITVQVSDSGQNTASRALAITVNPVLPGADKHRPRCRRGCESGLFDGDHGYRRLRGK